MNTNDSRLAKQIEFIVEIDKLKQVYRRTWLTDESRKENDAEHSWHLGVMAILLLEHAQQPHLDLLRVLMMVLIHDLVEIDAGDTFVYDDARPPYLQRERGMDEHHLSELGPDGLEPDGDYAGVVLRDYELTQRGLDGISLEGSLLSKIRAAGIPLARLRLSDAIARDGDFANAAWARARFTAVSLSKCRLTGWNVADGVFRKVEFVGCKIDLAVFHNARPG